MTNILIELGLDEKTFTRLTDELIYLNKNTKSLRELMEEYVKDMNQMEKEMLAKGIMLFMFLKEGHKIFEHEI